MDPSCLIEINIKITEKIMLDCDTIHWSYIRKFCESNEEADKLAKVLKNKLGFKIIY